MPSSSGGTRSYDLSRSFIDKGFKVVVITSSSFLKNEILSDRDRWTVKNIDNIELHILKSSYSNKTSFAKRIMIFFHFFLMASLRALKINCDLVLATSTPITVAVPALVKRTLQKTPYLFEVRDVWPEVPVAMGIIKNGIFIKLLNRFEAYIYKKAVHIVALSDDMKKSILERTRIPDNKISVIPNIAEIKRFNESKEDRSIFEEKIGFVPHRSVLYAGTLGMVNGLTYVLELAKNCINIDPELKFIIVGDGLEKRQIVHNAERDGTLNRNVFFLEPMPKSELPQLYSECTVGSSFVIPVKELWANSANKFFDCIAAGRPIVVNYEGWQSKLIKEKNIGFVLSYGGEHNIKEAKEFCRYVNDIHLMNEQGIKAKELAKERFSLEVSSSNYLLLINQILKSN